MNKETISFRCSSYKPLLLFLNAASKSSEPMAGIYEVILYWKFFDNLSLDERSTVSFRNVVISAETGSKELTFDGMKRDLVLRFRNLTDIGFTYNKPSGSSSVPVSIFKPSSISSVSLYSLS